MDLKGIYFSQYKNFESFESFIRQSLCIKCVYYKKKLDDLKKLQDYILEEHMPFYWNMFGWRTSNLKDNPIENADEYNYEP